jgi:3-hydroxyacyl-CoA dehydrogenase
MSMEIKRVAVIGSGTMGGQIAAHVANAGLPVLLLDIVPKGAADRNALAKGAVDRLLKSDPSPFMRPDLAKKIAVGNLEDDLDKLKDADWIVEAVLENPQVKSDLYKRIDAVRKPGSIVTSNTSSIPLSYLTTGQSPSFMRDFMIAHFFNPVRSMRLMELVTGPETRVDGAEMIRAFCDRALGKGVVFCNDTPGFVANRLGLFFLQSAVNAAMDLGLTVEEADAVCVRLMGLPRTGVFGLIDLIGLDFIPLVAQSLLATLPADDPYKALYRDPPLFRKMVLDGCTGRKGKGGFYRVRKTDTGSVKESIDLQTGVYAASTPAMNQTIEIAGRNLRALCEVPDKIGRFAWRVLSETLSYVFLLIPATVPDLTSVDEAMQLGYNWSLGPFELIDKLGADWMAKRLHAEGRLVSAFLQKAAGKTFYRLDGGKRAFLTLEETYAPIKRADGVLLLADIKRANRAVAENPSASLWDIGDGVLCLEVHTKMNVLDSAVLTMIHRALALIGDGRGSWKGLVIHNDAGNFSAGANLSLFADMIKAGAWDKLEAFLKEGQAAFRALRFAPFPSVAAPTGFALGGGCEMLLHCSALQAHAECFPGLVETGVGLIPGWGGCAQLLGRAAAALKGADGSPVTSVFRIVWQAKRAKSAAEARDLYILRPTDGITMNKDRLLFDAKQRVLDLARDYHAPEPLSFSLPGASGRAALDLEIESAKQQGKMGPHDLTIGKALAELLCGDQTGGDPASTEESLMAAERKAFMNLARTPETLARIQHMLATGKALRN